MTFSFANGVPEIDGDDLPVSELNEMIGGVVEHSIERIRELVRTGEIA